MAIRREEGISAVFGARQPGSQRLLEQARCEQLAQHLLIHGTPFDPLEIVGRIEMVDDAAIRRVVARWRSAPPTLTALGPLSGLEEFDRVKDRFAA